MVVQCPACERRLRVKESTRARKGRCPCGAIIILASSVDPKRSKRRIRKPGKKPTKAARKHTGDTTEVAIRIVMPPPPVPRKPAVPKAPSSKKSTRGRTPSVLMSVPTTRQPARPRASSPDKEAKGRDPGREETPPPSRKRRRRRALLVLFLMALAGGGLYWFFGSSASTFEVTLTVREPAGVDRIAEPVTSGVPLPEGAVFDTSELLLLDKATRKIIPCQFTVLSMWPAEDPREVGARWTTEAIKKRMEEKKKATEKEGKAAKGKDESKKAETKRSIKWVLLDFFADVKAGQSAEYTLTNRAPANLAALTGGRSPRRPVEVKENDGVVEISTGPLVLKLSKTRGTLIEEAKIDGRSIISPEKACEAVLKHEDGTLYRPHLCKPDVVEVEDSGPIRSCVRIHGKFLNDAKKGIFNGKVGYDLRITTWAGKPYAKLAFTFENNGWYGYRNERRKRQWLHWQIACAPGSYDLPETGRIILNQWLRYPRYDGLCRQSKDCPSEREREKRVDVDGDNFTRFFYYLVTCKEDILAQGNRAEGWASLYANGAPVLGTAVRHFWQNFPRGFEASRGGLTVVLWPEGGAWPRTEGAFQRMTYQMEGGRHKTAEVFVDFAQSGPPAAHGRWHRRIERALVAKAPAHWYAETGAVWPLAPRGATCDDEEIAEAMQRYDRLQMAKVHVDMGDPAGPVLWDPVEGTYKEARWGKVSIPTLREEWPEVYYGYMNFGDLNWSFGYCSLYYEWCYGVLAQYLRLDDCDTYYLADEMVRHRYDIDQYHVRNSPHYLGLLQRYEKGHHGNLQWEPRKRRNRWEYNASPSHTWNRGLLLHWAITGDPRSLRVARDNGEGFRRYFYGRGKLAQKEKLPSRQFRVPGWAIEAWLGLYEYTGEKKYLDWANELFSKSLLAMEADNGSCGHISKDGKQSAQFVSFIIEPVARLHRITGRADAAEFLKRVMDYQRSCIVGGRMEGDKYCYLRYAHKWEAPGKPIDCCFTSEVQGFMFADAYAYLYEVFGREEDLDLARRIFRDTMFYGGLPRQVDPKKRMPLGYHYEGSVKSMCSKMHAFSTRYHMLYLSVESELNGGWSCAGLGEKEGGEEAKVEMGSGKRKGAGL
jgi:hypothetical protein